MKDRKKKLLEKLETYFKKDEDIEEASLFTAEELGTPMDVLRVLVSGYGPGVMDILAEYSFIPFEGAEEVWYFSSVLTILTDIPKEAAPAVAGAIARLNFYLPYGSFGLSSDDSMLVYRSVTVLRSDHEDEKLYEDMELSADTALLIPERYTYLLEQISDGSLLMKDFLESLPK